MTMKDHVEPYEMNEAERRTDAALNAALSAQMLAGDIQALEQRIVDATQSQLPLTEVPSLAFKPPATATGLSTAWRIAAMIALGLMTMLVVAVWQLDVAGSQTAQASLQNTPSPSVSGISLVRVQDVGSRDVDEDLDMLALQVELLLASDRVFVSPEESLDQAIQMNQFTEWAEMDDGLF